MSKDAFAFAVPEVRVAERLLRERVEEATRQRRLHRFGGVKHGFRWVPRAAAEMRAPDAPGQSDEQSG